MSRALKRHLRKNQNAEIDFRLSLKDAKVNFDDDGTFKISWKPSRKNRHRWHADDGSSGYISGRHLARERPWAKSTGDTDGIGSKHNYGDDLSAKGDDEDSKIIGVMPSSNGHNLFLYEQSRIKIKNGKAQLKGRLLSSHFVVEHAKKIAYAFGEKVVRNHLLLERGLVDGNRPSLQYLSLIMSSNVTPTFWKDIDQLNDRIINHKPLFNASKRTASTSKGKRGPLFGLFDDVSDFVDDTVDDATDWAEGAVDDTSDAIDNAIDTSTEVIDDAADWTEQAIDTATDWTDKAIDDASKAIDDAGKAIEPIITPAEDLIDDGIHIIDQGIDFLLDPTGPTTISETIQFNLVSQNYNKDPFYAAYDANASITVDIIFNKGYLGALDPSTISIKLTPNIDMNASAGLELNPLVQSYNGSIDGPEYSEPNPVVGEVTLSSSLDYEFTATASVGEGVGGGIKVGASPEATLTFNVDVINPDPKLNEVNNNFTFSEDLDRLFKNFNPEGELVATITPVLDITALPVIPEDVPSVGGMGLANVGITYQNPIIFKYETTNPTSLQGSVSGEIEPELSILGQNIGGIPSLNIYEKDFTLGFG